MNVWRQHNEALKFWFKNKSHKNQENLRKSAFTVLFYTNDDFLAYFTNFCCKFWIVHALHNLRPISLDFPTFIPNLILRYVLSTFSFFRNTSLDVLISMVLWKGVFERVWTSDAKDFKSAPRACISAFDPERVYGDTCLSIDLLWNAVEYCRTDDLCDTPCVIVLAKGIQFA